ncbi:hypothetical protein [Mitsuaria sp. 7]|uniref:hypothetical protein n=1 Tax=Mitsuaria sp. 7 TaxID=1658665 RepID=UPI0007DD4E37|nr:hypothetical protein [Mitsuaria sp. 7]ANH67040.1 hypothetical protein ABE85_04690 [Mitsuaria sp. 7]
MFGLTLLGAVHTAFALVALVAGYALLLRNGRIDGQSTLGRTYVWCTGITCLTAFGIFRHGGFNIAHVLAIVTLVTLAIAVAAHRTRFLGGLSPYATTLGYSFTLFCHMIPGLNETFTRVPVGAPLFTGPDDPALQKAIGVVLLLFVILMGVQAWRIRKGPAAGRQPHPA